MIFKCKGCKIKFEDSLSNKRIFCCKKCYSDYQKTEEYRKNHRGILRKGNTLSKDNIHKIITPERNKKISISQRGNTKNLGKKYTLAHRKAISNSLKGRIMTKKWKENLSKAHIGQKSHRKGLSYKKEYGIENAELLQEKLSVAHIGIQAKEKHPNWRGGTSFEPYGIGFNKQLKEQIRKRDNHRCQQCFRREDELRTKKNNPYKLIIHHIDYDKQNNDPENLISLCATCHGQTNFEREDWTNYFKNL